MKYKTLILFLLSAFTLVGAPSDSLRVSFVNIYPGTEIYELEGHSALRIQQGSADIAISYGTFDFNAPNFVYRFVKGETDYWVTQTPWQYFQQYYVDCGRRMVEHHVMLDSVQKSRLLELLADNLRPENRTYRYNYVKDNCALRPLRLLEGALGDTLTLPQPTDGSATDTSFRQMMRRYHADYPWYQFGIDLALGSGIDYPISANEKAFAPIALDTQLPQATVRNRPLTGEPVILFAGNDAPASRPTPWYLTPMAIAVLVLLAAILLTIRDIRHRRVTRWFDAAMFGIYGLAGLLLTFLIFVSVHEATSPNWLYLWLNPLCLIPPIFIWLKNGKTVVFSYQIVNFALIFAMAIAWPFTGQSANPAFLPLIAADALRALSYIYLHIKTKRIHAQV